MFQDQPIIDFDAIRLRLASPTEIRAWSHGEVTKPETINYRTQKPEKDGLFSERIFGPSKDWECHCGKYKKIRYKGIVCDKCGVEVTRAIVRRERMAHIELATPVSHIWFLRGVPSKVGIVLDMSVQNLEKVLYFAHFIILSVNTALREETLQQLRDEAKAKQKQIEAEWTRGTEQARQKEASEDEKNKSIIRLNEMKDEQLNELNDAVALAEKELMELEPMRIISEPLYRDLSLKYGHVFDAGIGGEAIYQLLQHIDMKAISEQLETELEDATGARRERLVRRSKLLKTMMKNNIRPEWMMLTVIPIIPPDLRPMVPLDGGRFATSDLNDLYRRVINRNNRLRQLLELNAPEVIVRNEKRMLQEAVDSLIDNSARHGKTVTASTGQKRQLKSIADMLKGKQGRFRQNLLGKRTDYSGRSVIVVGPHLKLHQCGLPKRMALELFKPFIISKLIAREIVHNVRSASRFIDTGAPIVWDMLEEVTKGAHVLLNRAPTLHRLGIQAFQPLLIEGKAIQVHPLVCPAFNADFDGDQMAVHVPLTEEAKKEAAELMLSSRNLLKPATGDPIVTPSQDVVWGCYYLTSLEQRKDRERVSQFGTPEDAVLTYQLRHITLQEPIEVRMPADERELPPLNDRGLLETTVGRIIFNRVMPKGIAYVNETLGKKGLSRIIRRALEEYEQEEIAHILDNLKELGFKYLTRSGLSWGMTDIPTLTEKRELLEKADADVRMVQEQYESGLLTDSERSEKVIELWKNVKKDVDERSKKLLPTSGSVFSMIDSGARGSWGQLTQIVGMKGLVTNPAGDIIELPVKGSFKEGFDVLEYFISTHGARKGLSDTALRTAEAGYLTRRLVDVAQDVIITEEDCGDTEGFVITPPTDQEEVDVIGTDIVPRLVGRTVLEPLKDGRKTIVKAGEVVTEEKARALQSVGLTSARIRSLVTCKSVKGACQTCYGFDLGKNQPIVKGVAVGIIAAQSIGEPGTQLTMRTFHSGGVAGKDITQGLPRVVELFEARKPKHVAFLAEAAGTVSIETEQRTIVDASGKEVQVVGRGQKVIRIAYREEEKDEYAVGSLKAKKTGGSVAVKDGQKVKAGDVLGTTAGGTEIIAERAGIVRIPEGSAVAIHVVVPADKVKEYIVPRGYDIKVKHGDEVRLGQVLTSGSLHLQQLYQLTNRDAVQRYILKEIQMIYFSQGQRVNEKHIELICRQMFSRVYVETAGDTILLPGEIVERAELLEENIRIAKEKGEPAIGREMLLGISKVSLSTRSFLSAASFQETARVLINAAITGKVDSLEGLKENVIIGRLIPAGTGYTKRRHQTPAA